MEKQVIFRDGMDNDPSDHNNLQAFTRQAFDHIVGDGLSGERRFAGFAAAQLGVAGVSLTAGRLYSGGQVYVAEAATTRDFATQLPLSTKKIVLAVVFGQGIETDARPREFLINEENGASEARTVAMESRRQCNVNFVVGQESPDPLDPIVDAGVLPIARIVLSPAGVASVEMIGDNRLASTEALAGRTAAVEDFQRRAEPQIVALGSDIAVLKRGQSGLVDKETYGRALSRLAVLEEKQGIPSNATDSDCDFFLDLEESDPTFAGYAAKVEEGIRFAPAASAALVLAIANPLDNAAKVSGGLLLPAYTSELRLNTGPRQAEVQVNAYSYQQHELVQRTMSRTRIRYGEEQTVCTNSAWWQSGRYDPVAGIFAKDGETFTVALEAEFGDVPGHNLYRVQRYWEDTYEEPYWGQLTVDHTIAGAQVAETFLLANGGIFDGVGVTFTKLDANGSVTVAICETDRGQPAPDRVIAITTVDRAALKVNEETRIPIAPTYLQGGKRYAVILITAGNHFVATTGGENFPQGTFFYILDGAYQQGDATRDLCLSLYAAKFKAARAVIDLNPLQLDGGMTAIDILADSIVPGSCDLTYEVRIGSVWAPLGPTTVSVLGAGGNVPALVPLRAVFTGTPDVMPILRLTGSQAKVSRARLALTHTTQPRTLPAASTQIRVMCRLEYFDAAHHTAGVKLRTGAGFATVVNPSAVTDHVTEDGALERTWIFNLGAAVTAYRIQSEATTDSPLRTFHFGWRKDWAL